MPVFSFQGQSDLLEMGGRLNEGFGSFPLWVPGSHEVCTGSGSSSEEDAHTRTTDRGEDQLSQKRGLGFCPHFCF